METRPGSMQFMKHEGAGNDFLVFVDRTNTVELLPRLVQSLCDRRRGVGADGIIRVGLGDGSAELSMELWNADGSIAEMSGNGMRCLAQAAVLEGLVHTGAFNVATKGGIRHVTYTEGDSYDRAEASVTMGPVTIAGVVPQDTGERTAVLADVANPHLVLVVDDALAVDAAVLGPLLERRFPKGVNCEWISVRDDGDLDLVVYERGVGLTLACGTGSCASAAVAYSLGLVADEVTVHNPGGPLRVELGDDGGAVDVTLSGPVRKVADVTVDLHTL